MVNNILSSSGFILNKTYKETRFLTPPKDVTYAVYHDSYERRGADNLNLIKEHDITIEVYEYAPDKATEKNIEDVLDALGIEYVKQDRYWIHEEQLYQVIYEFSYIEKGGEN